MRPRISIWGSVPPSVRQLVHPSVGPSVCWSLTHLIKKIFVPPFGHIFVQTNLLRLGPDPHVARPKAHARCEAPQTLLTYLPLTNPTFSRFYYFWFILVIDYFSRTLKKTKIHTLLTYCSQILQMTYSFHLLSSPPSFSFPSSPFLVFILFFSPFSFFSFSFLLVFLPFLFFLFPPLKTSEGQWGRPEARGPLKREA